MADRRDHRNTGQGPDQRVPTAPDPRARVARRQATGQHLPTQMGIPLAGPEPAGARPADPRPAGPPQNDFRPTHPNGIPLPPRGTEHLYPEEPTSPAVIDPWLLEESQGPRARRDHVVAPPPERPSLGLSFTGRQSVQPAAEYPMRPAAMAATMAPDPARSQRGVPAPQSGAPQVAPLAVHEAPTAQPRPFQVGSAPRAPSAALDPEPETRPQPLGTGSGGDRGPKLRLQAQDRRTVHPRRVGGGGITWILLLAVMLGGGGMIALSRMHQSPAEFLSGSRPSDVPATGAPAESDSEGPPPTTAEPKMGGAAEAQPATPDAANGAEKVATPRQDAPERKLELEKDKPSLAAAAAPTSESDARAKKPDAKPGRRQDTVSVANRAASGSGTDANRSRTNAPRRPTAAAPPAGRVTRAKRGAATPPAAAENSGASADTEATPPGPSRRAPASVPAGAAPEPPAPAGGKVANSSERDPETAASIESARQALKALGDDGDDGEHDDNFLPGDDTDDLDIDLGSE